MNALKTIQGIGIPMNISDIDTDIIIPAQYLTSTSQKGYGQHAFARLKTNPDFILNQKHYKHAPILITGSNFGCGSSREHAVWAIKELGIQAIIATSFADIFSNNAQKNGLLLVQLDQESLQTILELCKDSNTQIGIDVVKQTISSGPFQSSFEMDDFFKHCLLNGLDEMDYLMSHTDEIRKFKNRQKGHSVFITQH